MAFNPKNNQLKEIRPEEVTKSNKKLIEFRSGFRHLNFGVYNVGMPKFHSYPVNLNILNRSDVNDYFGVTSGLSGLCCLY